MYTFRDDEAGYLAWVTDNPTGYVLNVPRQGTSVAIVLHSASCRSISGAFTNYTTTDYYKICAHDQDPLIAWADVQPQTLQRCGRCQP